MTPRDHPAPFIESPGIRLSVVIRCRNEATRLRNVCEALQAQRFDLPWELIVVDNQSEDDTRQVCEHYGARVVTIGKDEFTYGRALNLGISHAKGDLVLILSAHAMPIGSRFLESATAPFGDPLMAAVRCLWVGNTRQVLNWYKPNDLQFRSVEEQRATEQGTEWLGKYPTATCCVIRRSIWEVVKYNEDLEANEDKLWASEVLSRGLKIRCCAEATWAYARSYSRAERWRKENREAIALYRITGHTQLDWLSFLVLTAKVLVKSPFVAARYIMEEVGWNWHLVTIPLKARSAPKPGSLPSFEQPPS